jgi:hypothetical protein
MKSLGGRRTLTPDRWRQIEDLYQAAQNCAPSERAALLECTDPEIRARVERVLEVESSGRILDQPAKDFLADPTRTVVAPGAQLGHYQVQTHLSSCARRAARSGQEDSRKSGRACTSFFADSFDSYASHRP